MHNTNELQQNVEASDKLFSELAAEWMQYKSTDLKASSYMRYHEMLTIYLLPVFGERSIASISRKEVETFARKLLTHGGHKGKALSPGTVNGILSVLRALFTYYNNMYDLACVDVRGIRMKQSPKPFRIFTRREQDRLNRYLIEHQTLCNLGILLSLYTGMRIGEVCALKWDGISLDERCIYVRQTMQRIPTQNPSGSRTSVILTTPKSITSLRTIPLPNILFSLLRNIEEDPDCFFLTAEPQQFIEPRTMENHFDAAMKACGIEGATFHTCRHTFATRCIELGFDMKSLSEILGHASVKITMDRYVHPSLEYKRENMNRLSSLMAESLETDD